MIRGRVVVLLLLFLIAPAVARACVCSKAPPGMCPGLQKDDVAFVGTVTAAENVAQDPNTPTAPAVVRFHFRINERFAGENTSEIDIFAGGDDCDQTIKLGFYFFPCE